MCLSKTSLYSCNSVTNSQQSWYKTSTQQCSGLHSEQEGFGVWFPPRAFYVWQRFPPGSQVPQFKDTRWQLRTVCRSLSVNGCLSLLVALQCTGHWSGAQPNFAPRQLGETPSPVTLRAGEAAIENVWPETNQSPRSNQAALSHTLLLFRSQEWTLR